MWKSLAHDAIQGTPFAAGKGPQDEPWTVYPEKPASNPEMNEMKGTPPSTANAPLTSGAPVQAHNTDVEQGGGARPVHSPSVLPGTTPNAPAPVQPYPGT